MKEFTQQHYSPTPPGLAAHEPVPEGHHFVSITSHRNTEGPGQPKVSQLDLALGIHQQVLRLQIPEST